ncbi:MAG: hypothetical protein K0U47_03065 [Epsilonproteobacteria bacterium]|nr:hypothetical protein [Campylobacterota bacterium]
MIVSFFEEGEKKSYEIDKAHYFEIVQKSALNIPLDLSEYPYEISFLEKLVALKGSKQKTKSDIDYASCEYDTQL